MTGNSQDPRTATHHWYPFLRYQEECKAAGKEATVDGWMRSNGKLQDKIDFEKRKAAAQAAEAKPSKPQAEKAPASE